MVAVAVIIAAAGVFFLSTLRSGHDWGDDFALYIMHAMNIVHGHAYARTGYIDNPAVPGFSPAAYPPLFSLMLSPVVAIWGLRFTPMKVEIVLFFVAALVSAYLLFRKDLGRVAMPVLIAILGFSPFLWAFKDQVLSDIPFLFFVLVAVYAMHAYLRSAREPSWRAAAVIGALTWIAFATRTVGIVLIPAFIAAVLLSRRWSTKDVVSFLGVFAILLVGQHLVFGGGQGSYLNELKPTGATIRANVRALPRELQALWAPARAHTLVAIISVGVVALAVVGFLARLLRRVTILELFPVVYLLGVIIWPSGHQGARLLIPLIPFLFFFALASFEPIGKMTGRLPAAVVGAACALALFGSYGAAYTAADFGPIRAGVEQPAAIRFFRFIDTDTPKHAVFIFYRPRALALFTGRSASVFEPEGTSRQNWLFFRRIRAEYLALAPSDHARSVMVKVVEAYRSDLTEVYAGDSYRIYRITSFGSV